MRLGPEPVKERGQQAGRQACQTTYIFHCEKPSDDAGLPTLYLCGFGTVRALIVRARWKQNYDQSEIYFHLFRCLSI